jgi:hypothetical protein
MKVHKVVVVLVTGLIFASCHIWPPMSYTNVDCIDDLTHSLTEPALLWL